MAHLLCKRRRPIVPRTGFPVRGRGGAPRVSSILLQSLGVLVAIVLCAKALAFLTTI